MAPRKNFSWIHGLLFAALGMLVVLPLTLSILFSSAIKQGEEFSPDDFSRRRFNYVQLPLVNWVIRGIEYDPITSDFEQSLAKNNWIPVSPATTWHLYREGYGIQAAECDARFLVELLAMPTATIGFVYYWDQWTDRYPELAKSFWPLVAQLAQDEMYLAVPEFMQLAIDLDSQHTLPGPPAADDFQQRLNEYLGNAYQQFAEIDQTSGRIERAELRFQRAAEFANQ